MCESIQNRVDMREMVGRSTGSPGGKRTRSSASLVPGTFLPVVIPLLLLSYFSVPPTHPMGLPTALLPAPSCLMGRPLSYSSRSLKTYPKGKTYFSPLFLYNPVSDYVEQSSASGLGVVESESQCRSQVCCHAMRRPQIDRFKGWSCFSFRQNR